MQEVDKMLQCQKMCCNYRLIYLQFINVERN